MRSGGSSRGEEDEGERTFGDPSSTERCCLYDDPLDPSELTIFARGTPERTTAWITAAESTAVPLEAHR